MTMKEELPTRLVVSIAKAAELLDVSPQTVARMVERGELKKVRVSTRRVGVPYASLLKIAKG